MLFRLMFGVMMFRVMFRIILFRALVFRVMWDNAVKVMFIVLSCLSDNIAKNVISCVEYVQSF
jgi:hypothetical protein